MIVLLLQKRSSIAFERGSQISNDINPLKGRAVNWLHFVIQVYPTFLISDIRAQRQSARMSEIKNVG